MYVEYPCGSVSDDEPVFPPYEYAILPWFIVDVLTDVVEVDVEDDAPDIVVVDFIVDDVDVVVESDVVVGIEVVVEIVDDVDVDVVEEDGPYTYTAATMLPPPTKFAVTLYVPALCELHIAMYELPDWELNPSVTAAVHPEGSATELQE